MSGAGVREIPLRRGGAALVDDEDFARFGHLPWLRGVRDYVNCSVDGKTLLLHRCILAAPSGVYVDHANGDPLDNRRANLRPCTPSQNAANRGRSSNNTSGFKGVMRARRRWVARIMAGRNRRYLGTFDTREEAARAYDDAARQLHGEFAVLNFPEAA